LQVVAVMLFRFLTLYLKSFAQRYKENNVGKMGWHIIVIVQGFPVIAKNKLNNN
jgi:hypothetical protein